MSRFFKYIFLTVLFSFIPIGIVCYISKNGLLTPCLILIIVSVSGYIVHFNEEEDTKYELWSHQNRANDYQNKYNEALKLCKSLEKNLKIELINKTEGIVNLNREIDVLNDACGYKPLTVRKDAEYTELSEEFKKDLSRIEYGYNVDCEEYRKLYIKTIENIKSGYKAACVEMLENNMDNLYSDSIQFLFPEKEVSRIDFEKAFANEDEIISFFSDILKRLSYIETYKQMLSRVEKALQSRKYSPYIYTTLAEAYSNRIIADYFKNEFNQTEVFPPVARISAELQTLYLSDLAQKLDWGENKVREKKVQSLILLKRESREYLELANSLRYQLDYLLALYPELSDILDINYEDLKLYDPRSDRKKSAEVSDDSETESQYDYVIDYLTKEEYSELSETERNQLALDRYIKNHSKTKWQIGRDYELYIGYLCERRNCSVEYTGSTLRLEDLGRDLIVRLGRKTYIIQCKYWSKQKLIHEKHVMQLFGTVELFKMEHPLEPDVFGVFITSTTLSETAKKIADYLGIEVHESVELDEYPRIKCNIRKLGDGSYSYIYHLPMDLSYDVTKIDSPGEFMAFTVAEAEEAGFRRSYKYHFGN